MFFREPFETFVDDKFRKVLQIISFQDIEIKKNKKNYATVLFYFFVCYLFVLHFIIFYFLTLKIKMITS